MKSICIIPARGGSKRIKNKNLRLINKKSLLSYSIEKAKNLKIFERIIVSTDSKLIEKEALLHGAEVVLRPKKLADDFTPIKKVLTDIILKNNLRNYDLIVCLYATSPLLKISTLKKAISKIYLSKKYDMLLSVNSIESKFNRALKNEKGYLSYLIPKNQFARSQDLKKIFIDSGSFIIFRPQKYIKSKNNILKKTTFFEVSNKEGIDIDQNIDLTKVKRLMAIN